MQKTMISAAVIWVALSTACTAHSAGPLVVTPIPASGPSAAPQASTQPVVPERMRTKLRSPEYLADHRVTLRIRAPKATEVACETIVGRFPMTRDEGGIWSVTIGPLEPDIYEYTLNVDGVRFNDPANPTSKTPQVSFLPIAADQPAPWELTDVPHGKVQFQWYASKSLHETRRVHVYTPPGYDAAAATQYPVLYLLHGSGDDDSGWVNVGKANLIFDNLLASGKMKPMIVVMPEGHTSPYPNPLPTGKPTPAPPTTIPNSGTASFSSDLINDVIPLIESSYKVKADTAHRAVAGLSMGGGQSLYLAMTYPDRFAYVVLMSAGMRGMDDPGATFPSVANGLFKKGSPFKLFWIGCGKKDRLLPPNVKVDKWLTEQGVAHEFHQSEGSHDWRVWRRNLVDTTQLLFAE